MNGPPSRRPADPPAPTYRRGMSTASLVAPPVLSGSWTLADVTVIDPASGEAAPHRDVRIAGERVASVEPHRESARRPANGTGTHGRAGSPADDGAARVDGSGLFVIPTFVDSHVHLLNHPDDIDG